MIIKLNRATGAKLRPLAPDVPPEYLYLVKRAVNCITKRYKCLGSLTYEDLYQEAFMGALSAVRSNKWADHPNKKARVFSFAYGYCTHLLHRKSRLISPPWSVLRDSANTQNTLGHACLEMLPPNHSAFSCPQTIPLSEDVISFLDTISSKALNRFNSGEELPAKYQRAFAALVDKYHD